MLETITNNTDVQRSWMSVAFGLVAISLATGLFHGVAQAGIGTQFDLNDGTLFHNEPTFTHPSDPPTAPNGEIEDDYFSRVIRFEPITLTDESGSNTARIRVDFVSADTGATQRLRLDAKGTGSPFPETFALRFPGAPSHSTIGPGMFLTSSLGTVQGVGTGTLTVTLTGVRRAGSDDVVPPNPYTVDLSCFIDDCDTDAHFPGNRDLTDANMSFTGLVIDVTLDDFERCSLSRPDCQGITFDGFSFAMLAGDLAIVETSNIVSINYDLNNGTLNQESGTAEDSFFSQLIPFGAITLASSDKTAELQINFVNSVTGFKQRLELGALGTGFNNPEAFASREPGDCLGGLPPCSHDFGPGMIVSNSMGSLGDAFTTMQTTVKLTNPDGNFAGDFINPYVWGAPPLTDPIRLCGPSDPGPQNSECRLGVHFPDLVDGDDFASFDGIVVDLKFGSTVGSSTAVNADGFQFNMLAGALRIIESDPIIPGSELAAALLPASRSVQVGNTATAFATIINIGSNAATACGIAPLTSVQADFSYQTTDANNALIGTADTPIDIAAGANQNYLFALTPTASFSPVDVQLTFDCVNTEPAVVTVGLNTLLLVADSGPVPDIVALAATPTADGIVNLENNSGVFAVATVNVGVAGNITVSADTGGASLPQVSIALCETNPATGECINPAVPTTGTVTTSIAAGDTPTFAFFVTSTDTVPFDPANNRIFVRFQDAGGVTRGSTSVAVRTL